jgi:hypothetical protein
LRLDELAETFCDDGLLELRGSEPLRVDRLERPGFDTGALSNPTCRCTVEIALRAVKSLM